MPSIQLVRHDATMHELAVTPEHMFREHRIAVRVPRDVDRETLLAAADQLAAYARLVCGAEDVVVDRRTLLAEWRRIRATNRFHEGAFAPAFVPAFSEHEPERHRPTDDAIPKARRLLESVDAELLARLDAHRAFYFTTSTRTYIWYPASREIVSLEDEGPAFVCVHSRDHAVETNVYDWALTMRTFLLGDETHWRAKANFHPETFPRGEREAYAEIEVGEDIRER